MMKNWKRCLSVVMTLAMLVAVLPTAAFAEEGIMPLADPTEVNDLEISYGEGQATEFTYNGEVQVPQNIVVSSEAQEGLTEADYDLIYQKGDTEVDPGTIKDAGTYTIQAQLKGSYSGTSTNSVTFTIKQAAWPVTDVTVAATHEYNGSTPTVDISGGTEGSYSVTYKKGEETLTAAPVDVGSYSVVVAPTANYTGEAITKSFTITAKPWSVDSIQVTGADSEGNLTYSGSVAAIQVLDASNNAVPDAEYMLTYQKGTETLSAAPSNAGSYTVTASPTANYSGSSVSKSFTIAAKTLTAPTVEDITDQTYTGSAITPKLTVKDGETTLTKDTDYTVVYSNNTNAGPASAAVTFTGNYSGGPFTKEFTIVAKSISGGSMSGLNSACNKNDCPVPTITVDGKNLVKDTDFTLVYVEESDNLKITATGTGNYTGQLQTTIPVLETSDTTAPLITGVEDGKTYYAEQTATITDTNLEKVEVYQNGVLGSTRTPEENTTSISVPLAFSNTPYQIKAYDKVGNVTTITVTVTKKAVTSGMITIAGADNIVYDGTAKTPAITVKDDSTTIAAENYTLSWENNTNAGTATVKVTMNSDSNYQGEATKTFTIKPKALQDSAIQDIADQVYTGSPITPTVTVMDGTKTLEMGADKDYTVSYSNNTNPGTAKVTVVLRGNYTGTLEKTFTIGQDLSALIDNIETLAGKTTLTYAEKQQIKQLKAAYDALSATDKATVDNAVGSTLMTSFKNKASAARFQLLNLPSLGYYRYTKGTSSNVVIKIDADYSRTIVTEIRMGKNLTVIDPEYYEVTEGSVVVTLKSSYLKKIKDTGKYNLYIDLTDTETGHTETLQTVVRVLPATDIPQTGDPFKMNLWIGLLGASVLALAGLGVYEVVKKKKNGQKRLEAAMNLDEEPSDEANTNE